LDNLPKRGIVMSDGKQSELTMWELPTNVSDGSASVSWPTPRTQMTRSIQIREDGYHSNLKEAVAMMQNWPTPTTAEAGKISNRPNYGQQGLSNHPAIVGEPDREKMEKSRGGDGRSTQPGHLAPQTQTDGSESSMSDQTSPPPSPKRLNPNFVEWLMAVPIGWTDLKPLEMDSFHQWLQNFYEG